MESPATTPTLTAEPAIPEECGHKDWELGCKRCFFEMNAMARGNLRSQTMEDHLAGALILVYHLMALMDRCLQQIKPQMSSIDLQKNSVAKEVYANLVELQRYFVNLLADPHRMQAAMQEGAEISIEMKRAIEERKQGIEREPKPESNLIITDI